MIDCMTRNPTLLEHTGMVFHAIANANNEKYKVLKQVAKLTLSTAASEQVIDHMPYGSSLESYIVSSAFTYIAVYFGLELADRLIENPRFIQNATDTQKLVQYFDGTIFVKNGSLRRLDVGKYTQFIPEIYRGESIILNENTPNKKVISEGDICLRMHLVNNLEKYDFRNTASQSTLAILLDIVNSVPDDMRSLCEVGTKEGWLNSVKGIVGESHFARKSLVGRLGMEFKQLPWRRRAELALEGMEHTSIANIELSIIARLNRLGHGIGSQIIIEDGEYAGRKMYIQSINFYSDHKSYYIGYSDTHAGKVKGLLKSDALLRTIMSEKLMTTDSSTIESSKFYSLQKVEQYLKWARGFKHRIDNAGEGWISMADVKKKYLTTIPDSELS